MTAVTVNASLHPHAEHDGLRACVNPAHAHKIPDYYISFLSSNIFSSDVKKGPDRDAERTSN